MKTLIIAVALACASPLIVQAAPKVAQSSVTFSDSSDKKLSEAFTQFLAANPSATVLALSITSSVGKSVQHNKVIYDREKKHLLILRRQTFQLLTGPEDDYVWIIWYDVPLATIQSGIPWFDEKLRSAMSKNTDGVGAIPKNFPIPITYPDNPGITKWP